MSHSGYRSSSFDTYSSPPDLQPLLSGVCALVLGTLVLLISAATFVGLAPFTAPLESLAQLGEMVSLGVSSLLGKNGLENLAWDKASPGWGSGVEAEGLAALAGNGSQQQQGKTKLVRSNGKANAAGGGASLVLQLVDLLRRSR